MPLTFELNPPDIERAYLAGLQDAFGGWGTEDDYRWWFRRRVGAPAADLLAIRDGSELVAGIALTYRCIERPLAVGRESGVAAVFTGAWTSSRRRGEGCFSELLERGREVASDHRATLLMAFVRAARQSRGPVIAAAWRRRPSWYLRRSGSPVAVLRSAAAVSTAQLHGWFRGPVDAARIVYPTLPTFVDQARLRDPATSVVPAGDGGWAIVRDAPSGATLQALITESPHDPAARAQRLRLVPGALVAYTTDRLFADAAIAAGFASAPGDVFFFDLPGSATPEWADAPWELQAVDRA